MSRGAHACGLGYQLTDSLPQFVYLGDRFLHWWATSLRRGAGLKLIRRPRRSRIRRRGVCAVPLRGYLHREPPSSSMASHARSWMRLPLRPALLPLTPRGHRGHQERKHEKGYEGAVSTGIAILWLEVGDRCDTAAFGCSDMTFLADCSSSPSSGSCTISLPIR